MATGVTGMGSSDHQLLGLLQLADSTFPSGAYTLSHGLETLVTEGIVRSGDDLAEVLEVALVSRLALADLPALLGAHAVAADVRSGPGRLSAAQDERLRSIDRSLRAVKLAREEREGSERVGRRLAIEAAALVPSPALDEFVRAIEAHRTPGTSAVAFGLAAEAFGVEERAAGLAAGSSFALAFVMAGVRLGLIGHRDAQLIVRAAGPWIERAVDLAETIDPLDPRPSAPQLDVALARHETASMRAFAS
jgi:urease accessory protein